jgi:ABC-type multidrug transport system fused ATPase/permease subunit
MKTLKKCFEILSVQERKKAYFLLLMIVFMALIEMLGVASILPFVAVITNPELIETNTFLSYFYQSSKKFGISNIEDFIFFFGVVVLCLLIFSIFFKALTIYAQTRFVLMREYSLGRRLIEGYLHQPYEWFLSKNSAELGKNVLSQISLVTQGPLLNVMNLIAQSAVAIALITLTVFTDPWLAASVALVFSFSYSLIYIFTKSLLKKKGSESLEVNKLRFTAVNEAFGAAKEVKIGGLEKFFIKRFSEPAKIFASNSAFSNILGGMPRYLLEAIAFGGMIFLVLIMMSRGDNFNSIAPKLALYAFVGYRLLPAFQGIYYATSSIRYSHSILDSLHKDLMNLSSYPMAKTKTKTSSMILANSIKLKNIKFSYPGGKRTSLENISLIIPAFSKVGIVGSTGSGKTTMVDVILGLLDPQAGELIVDDSAITNINKRSWQKSIGYVPQQIYLADDTVASNIAFGVETKHIDQKLIEKASKMANLHDFVTSELPKNYNTIIGERGIRLSGGQRQRIGIARALYQDPKILILDEATSSLDNLTENMVMEAMNNLGNKITTIIIAHRLSTVKKCDQIYLLNKGRIEAQGTFEDLLITNKNFKKMASI